jgi:hypothetical protein
MPSSNDLSAIARLNLNKDKVDEIIARKRANIDPAKAAIYAAMSDDELWEENNKRGRGGMGSCRGKWTVSYLTLGSRTRY